MEFYGVLDLSVSIFICINFIYYINKIFIKYNMKGM